MGAGDIDGTKVFDIDEIRDEISQLAESVQSELDQGVHSLESAMDAQIWIEKTAARAAKVGLHGELDLLRRLHDQVERQKYALLLFDVIDKLHHGARPPTPGYEYQWEDYAGVIARSRDLGLDVRRAEAAVAGARRVAADWERGRLGIDDDDPPTPRPRDAVSVSKPTGLAAPHKPQLEHGSPPEPSASPPSDPAPSPPRPSASVEPEPPASPPSSPAPTTSPSRLPATAVHVEPEPSTSPPSSPAPATSPATRVEPVQPMQLPPGLADALAACFPNCQHAVRHSAPRVY